MLVFFFVYFGIEFIYWKSMFYPIQSCYVKTSGKFFYMYYICLCISIIYEMKKKTIIILFWSKTLLKLVYQVIFSENFCILERHFCHILYRSRHRIKVKINTFYTNLHKLYVFTIFKFKVFLFFKFLNRKFSVNIGTYINIYFIKSIYIYLNFKQATGWGGEN